MEAVFLKLLNMSITASWIVLAVFLFRIIFRKAPKWILCALWALVGLRLLLPFSFESVASLIPTAEPIPQSIIEVVTPNLSEGNGIIDVTPSVPAVTNPSSFEVETNVAVVEPIINEPVSEFSLMSVISAVWLVGVCVMIFYMIVSYFSVYNNVKASIQIRDSVYVCDNVKTPFILGVIRPRIFLPSSMNERELDYVVSHEMAHISRRDHYWKPLGFLLLSVYWFNPVIWIAYVLLCRDIEFACDERVIKRMTSDEKKQYSTVLLNCSIPKRMIAACPLAFGEVGVKSRIKSVLNYKKPAFWIIILAIIASAIVAVCFLTNPVENDDAKDISEEFLGDRVVTLSTVEFLYHHSYDIASESVRMPHFRIDEENRFYYLGEENSWIFGGDVSEIELTEDELSAIFNTIPAQGVNETRGDLDAENMMQNNKKAYVCIKDNGSVDFASFYVILLQNDGTIYVIYGKESVDTITVTFVCRAEETDKELPDKIYDGSIPNNGAQIFYFKSPIDEDNTEELKSSESTAEVKTFDNGQRTKLLKILKSNKFVWDAILDRITFEYDGVIDLYVGGEVYKIYFSSEHNVLYCNEYLCEISEFDMDRIRCGFSGDRDVSFAPSVGGINIRSSVAVDSTSGIYKDAINADMLDNENEVHFPVHRISSEKALREFIDKYGDELPLDDLKPVSSRYYQEFFDDNELFIIYVSTDSLVYYDFENFTVLEDNVLKFCFTQSGEEAIKGSALICVEKPKLYVSYFAAGFDAVVTMTEDTPRVESKIVKTSNTEEYHPIKIDPLNVNTDSRREYKFLHKVESYEKLNEMKNSFVGVKEPVRGEVTSKTHEYFSNLFNEHTKEYDESFFQRNDLFVLYFISGSSWADFLGVEVYKSENIMNFRIVYSKEGVEVAMEEYFLAFISVPKGYSDGISEFNIGYREYKEHNYREVLTYKNPNDLFPAAIYLTDSGLFTFNYSSLSSNVPMGRYEITNEKLILNADNGDVYVFSKVDGGYTFDAEASAKLPEYKISGDSNETYSPVPDGAVFYSNENSNVSPEEMLQISRKLAIAERTASYFTGYARDVYGNESIEIDGVRYDVFKVYNTMRELVGITCELFDNELANTLINTQVDGHPLFVEQNGRLYRFGGYVALERVDDATANVYGVTKNSNGVYTVQTVIRSNDGEVVSGYEYHCIKSSDNYKFIDEFKLPIEVINDIRNK